MPKITKKELGGNLTVIGKVLESSIRKNEDDMDELMLKVKYGRTTIFIFEKKPDFIEKMKKYKINDVVRVSGKFIAEWFPGQKKAALPIIKNVVRTRKLGIFQD